MYIQVIYVERRRLPGRLAAVSAFPFSSSRQRCGTNAAMKLDFDEFCHGITQALNGRGSETSARPEQPCFCTRPCYVSLLPAHLPGPKARSEERRVGQECVSTWRTRRTP